MKRILLAIAVVLAMVSCKKPKCEIYGAIDNLNAAGYVYLTDEFSAREVIDSVEIVDGNRFHFKSVDHHPTFAQILLKTGRPIAHLFIEEGKVRVSGDYEKGDIKVSGTPANDAYVEMMARNMELIAEYRKAVAAKDSARAEEIDAEHDAMLKDCYEKNNENILALFILRQLSSFEPAVKTLERLNALPAKLQEIPVVKRMRDNAERKFKTEPQGESSDYVPHYINIEQPNLAGEMVSLKSVVENEKNRYVLLDFWASWCGPCMAEMPVLKQAYKLYNKRGFEIYGVSFDEKHEAWKRCVEQQQMKWVNVSLLQRFKTPATEDYVVESIPTNFLIDCSNGVIVAKNLRGKAVLEKLEELFKE